MGFHAVPSPRNRLATNGAAWFAAPPRKALVPSALAWRERSRSAWPLVAGTGPNWAQAAPVARTRTISFPADFRPVATIDVTLRRLRFSVASSFQVAPPSVDLSTPTAAPPSRLLLNIPVPA